jgi:hypothetical protein
MQHRESAKALEEESGILMEPQEVATFRSALQRGDWGIALDLVDAISPHHLVQQVRIGC